MDRCRHCQCSIPDGQEFCSSADAIREQAAEEIREAAIRQGIFRRSEFGHSQFEGRVARDRSAFIEDVESWED